MGFSVVFTGNARKQLLKLDKAVAVRIANFLSDLGGLENPRARGKALTGDRSGLWRYRVGDYRIICELRDHELVILVLETGHRSRIYDN